VQGVSFAVDRGERLGLVGESGCGKTTTILALMGLLPPTASVAGRVLLDGDDVLEMDAERVRAIRGGRIERTFADGKKETVDYRPGQVRVNQPGPGYTTKNVGKSVLVLYVVQVK
jgi:ABC-type oligopeptide transport system ATPase subunit